MKDRSKFSESGNSGFLNLRDDLGNSKTAAHEYGHSLGLDHPVNSKGEETGDWLGKGVPSIMVSRGYWVDKPYRYSDGNDEYPYVDPAKRRVIVSDISHLGLSKIHFDANDKGCLGDINFRKKLYDANGRPVDLGSKF